MEVLASLFVNREKELRQITEAVETLQDEQRLLRTPLIEFSGVQGIGKTTLLQEVKAICDGKNLSCIMENAEQITLHEFNRIESLVKQEPVAIILDSLDAANNEQFQAIETRLSELIESTRLFVVLASRNVQKFDHTRSLARKLTIYPLEPLKREYCVSYLDNFAQDISSETRGIIFDWTRGYPLAMSVLTEAIVKGRLDPTQDQDRKQLLSILMQRVVEEKLLASANSDTERTRLQTLLALLSIPRRFNLTLSQDLIEHFAPQYKFESSLAYITLPKSINEVTSVLNWSLERAGYSIEAPVRNLFLLYYRIEHPQQYLEIHKFLAEKNKGFITQVSGSHRIRYLRDFFYHLACIAVNTGDTSVRENLEKQIAQLVHVQTQDEHSLLSSLEDILQFYEEFLQDQELQDALGPRNAAFALLQVYRSFIKIYRQLPENIRGNWLREFFSLVARQSTSNNFDLIFEEGMRQIIKQVARDEASKLYYELIQDKGLKGLLGEQFEAVKSRIYNDLLA